MFYQPLQNMRVDSSGPFLYKSPLSSLSKITKLGIAVLIILSAVFIVFGAAGIVGDASFWLLVFGSSLLGILIVGATFLFIHKQFMEKTVIVLRGLGQENAPPLTPKMQNYVNEIVDNLKERKTTLTPLYWESLHPPVNEDIPYLLALRNEARKSARDILQANDDTLVIPESINDLKQAYLLLQESLKISFTIAYLALHQIPDFLAKHPDYNSPMQAMGDPKSCYSRLFSLVTNDYVLIRFLHIIHGNTRGRNYHLQMENLFYTENSFFNDCREFYNCFCQQARWCFIDEIEPGSPYEILHSLTYPDHGSDFLRLFNLS
ncbi:hypothetical protein [Chlamydia vaughanii]|uniref:hypothetical protein n=1 Tax=Chlamydia vaughanii TaxID=3112552 RepID=UPI0039F4F674